MATTMEKKALVVWMSHHPMIAMTVYYDDGFNGKDVDKIHDLMEEGSYEEGTALLIKHGWRGECVY